LGSLYKYKTSYFNSTLTTTLSGYRSFSLISQLLPAIAAFLGYRSFLWTAISGYRSYLWLYFINAFASDLKK